MNINILTCQLADMCDYLDELADEAALVDARLEKATGQLKEYETRVERAAQVVVCSGCY